MKYYGNVFRPPSEARSLIIQVTIGCAHNDCTFCYMYKGEPFIIRPLEDVKNDLIEMSKYSGYFDRIFLADGDALVVKTEYLLEILKIIRELFPNLGRVSAYATAQDINRKSLEELKELYNAGLEMLYIGFESGSDEILGLGGVDKMRENAVETARVISITKPNYVGYLTMRLYKNTPMYKDYESGKFKMPDAAQILEEMKIFLENVDSQGTVFRSNHASNYVLLAGTLNEDKKALIDAIDTTLKKKSFRAEVLRGF